MEKNEEISIEEIVYIKAGEKCSILHLRDGNILISEKRISQYYEKYAKELGMPHRSYLINYQYIKLIDKKIHLLKTELVVPLSRYRRSIFMEEYKKYNERKNYK